MTSYGVLLLCAVAMGASTARWELPSVLGVRPGVDGFALVKRTLGDAAVQKGDIEVVLLCYASSVPSDSTVVLFESSLFGGEGAIVNAITVQAAPPAGMDPKTCTRTPRVSKLLRASSGLRLGMRQAEALRLLGEGVEVEGGTLSKTRTTVQEDGSRTFEYVGVNLTGGAVVEFAVGRVDGGGG
jgi:hypothetical protein